MNQLFGLQHRSRTDPVILDGILLGCGNHIVGNLGALFLHRHGSAGHGVAVERCIVARQLHVAAHGVALYDCPFASTQRTADVVALDGAVGLRIQLAVDGVVAVNDAFLEAQRYERVIC